MYTTIINIPTSSYKSSINNTKLINHYSYKETTQFEIPLVKNTYTDIIIKNNLIDIHA